MKLIQLACALVATAAQVDHTTVEVEISMVLNGQETAVRATSVDAKTRAENFCTENNIYGQACPDQVEGQLMAKIAQEVEVLRVEQAVLAAAQETAAQRAFEEEQARAVEADRKRLAQEAQEAQEREAARQAASACPSNSSPDPAGICRSVRAPRPRCPCPASRVSDY